MLERPRGKLERQKLKISKNIGKALLSDTPKISDFRCFENVRFLIRSDYVSEKSFRNKYKFELSMNWYEVHMNRLYLIKRTQKKHKFIKIKYTCE